MLVKKQIEAGRLAHVVIDGRTMCPREDVVDLKARPDVENALMTRVYAELPELELGRPMTLLERVEANAGAMRTVGRRVLEAGFRKGVPGYYIEPERFGEDIKEYPDGRRELIRSEAGADIVLRRLA